MAKFNDREIFFIGLVLEGFFCGFYSGVFAIYIQYQSSKNDTDKKRTIVFYSLCLLYVLSVALVISDVTQLAYHELPSKQIVSGLRFYFIETTLFCCCDFIAQFILIYRCWIVWGCNIRVVIIPAILTFVFLAIWLAGGNSAYISSDIIFTPFWGYSMTLSGFSLSLTINALVTGLIVFRIFKVFREVKATDDQILGTTGGSKLRRTIFVLIESGMALFAVQLARVVVTIVYAHSDNKAPFNIIVGIHEMLNGITPTIILVRTSMGLSFDDEKSMEEVAIESLRFTSNQSNSVQETGSVGIVGQENRDGDVGVERSSNDIELVAR